MAQNGEGQLEGPRWQGGQLPRLDCTMVTLIARESGSVPADLQGPKLVLIVCHAPDEADE